MKQEQFEVSRMEEARGELDLLFIHHFHHVNCLLWNNARFLKVESSTESYSYSYSKI
jgi:hypothetical protein